MAMCPKCFQQKAMLAEHCPNCTQNTPVGEQLGFSTFVTIGLIVLLIIVFG